MNEEEAEIILGSDAISLPHLVQHTCICGKGEYLDACPPFEKYYESLLFFDKSRMDFVNEICPRLRMLTQKKLRDQKNCFLVVGIQGIGKSQLLMSLGHWITAMGGCKTGFYFLSIGARAQSDPLASSIISIRYIIHDMSKRLGWNPPAECWRTIQDAWDWMLLGGYVALIVLDEFYKQYKVENTCGLFFDLYTIGNNSGPRPIVVILNGSSSLMQPLVFRLLERRSEVAAQYPGYAKSESLNSTKFIPFTLLPLSNAKDMKVAMSTLHDNDSDTDLDDAYYHALCINTRGTIRHFQSRSNRIKYSDGCISFSSELSPVYYILWNHLILNASSAFIAHCLSGTVRMAAIPEVPVRHFLHKGYSIRELHDFADNGIIQYSGGKDVSFVHPADILNCVVFFGATNLNPQPSILTAAEEVSLLYPHASATCEINEKLVCESLCEKGLTVAPYGRLTFSSTLSYCYPTSSELYCLKESSHSSSLRRGSVKRRYFTTQHISAELKKEWPDETGGDLIAVFAVAGFSRVRKGIKYIVVRVQVKLGFSSNHIGDPAKRMKGSEEKIADALGVRENEVDFVRVIWSSRKVSTVEHELGVNGQNIVINSENMLTHWSTRCSNFVKASKLSHYGYRCEN